MVAAIGRVLSHLSGTKGENETIQILTIFSLTGLVLSLLAARYGIDCSWAFF
jgi:hypothetical protein